jgi:glycosyltransferase involved in cell wall biosynthesis
MLAIDGERRPSLPLVSIIMPTFDRAAFLPAALRSLLRQGMRCWELVIVDDGSNDGTESAIKRFTADRRVQFHRFDDNRGLGAALNAGIGLSSAPLIAYLPSDDVFYRDHLASLLRCFRDPGVGMAYSGVRYGRQESMAAPEGSGVQLVQVMHRRTDDRWLERNAVVTDDLDAMLWNRLRRRGATVGTGTVTCEWVQHPGQRHKAIRSEYDGGLNVYRDRFQVAGPIKFRPSCPSNYARSVMAAGWHCDYAHKGSSKPSSGTDGNHSCRRSTASIRLYRQVRGGKGSPRSRRGRALPAAAFPGSRCGVRVGWSAISVGR